MFLIINNSVNFVNLRAISKNLNLTEISLEPICGSRKRNLTLMKKNKNTCLSNYYQQSEEIPHLFEMCSSFLTGSFAFCVRTPCKNSVVCDESQARRLRLLPACSSRNPAYQKNHRAVRVKIVNSV